MTTKVIEYKSGPKTVNDSLLETGEKDGIKHTWSGLIDDFIEYIDFTWNFDWGDLKKQGVNRLVGQLILKFINDDWGLHRVDIDWTDTNQSVLKTFKSGVSELVAFEYNLTAYYGELSPTKNISYDENFVASDYTDVVLIVEGKKLNVNRTFLSIHSDYFKTLFSSNFKEGQMKEIEIKEVSYEDFGLLLSIFHPNPQFPNDFTVEKLLEMADRFQVSSVIKIVEHHLLHISKIGYEKMLWLADEYGMHELLEKCINQMNSLEKAKKLKKSPEFEKLSHKTRSLILGILLEAV